MGRPTEFDFTGGWHQSWPLPGVWEPLLNLYHCVAGDTCSESRYEAWQLLVSQEKLKLDYLKGLPNMLKQFLQFLGKKPLDMVKGLFDWGCCVTQVDRGAHFSVFLQITFVDFLAYDTFDLHCTLEPICLDIFLWTYGLMNHTQCCAWASACTALFVSFLVFPMQEPDKKTEWIHKLRH